jgi:hypothetical protein
MRELGLGHRNATPVDTDMPSSFQFLDKKMSATRADIFPHYSSEIRLLVRSAATLLTGAAAFFTSAATLLTTAATFFTAAATLLTTTAALGRV